MRIGGCLGLSFSIMNLMLFFSSPLQKPLCWLGLVLAVTSSEKWTYSRGQLAVWAQSEHTCLPPALRSGTKPPSAPWRGEGGVSHRPLNTWGSWSLFKVNPSLCQMQLETYEVLSTCKAPAIITHPIRFVTRFCCVVLGYLNILPVISSGEPPLLIILIYCLFCLLDT